jgi:hypothetical protein
VHSSLKIAVETQKTYCFLRKPLRRGSIFEEEIFQKNPENTG